MSNDFIDIDRRNESRGRRESDCTHKDEFIRLWDSLASKVNMSIFKWVIGIAVILLMAQFNSIDNKVKIFNDKLDLVFKEVNSINVSIKTHIAETPANIYIDPNEQEYIEL